MMIDVTRTGTQWSLAAPVSVRQCACEWICRWAPRVLPSSSLTNFSSGRASELRDNVFASGRSTALEAKRYIQIITVRFFFGGGCSTVLLQTVNVPVEVHSELLYSLVRWPAEISARARECAAECRVSKGCWCDRISLFGA